jgi:tRNA pseudouridine65 synthase
MLEICYQDEQLVAINKPHGLLVHRSRIAEENENFALQLLRDQLGQKVYPTHRIDRKTGGLLLFALDKEMEIAMQKQFQAQEVEKAYWCVLRGYSPAEGLIDYALTKENGDKQEAITAFKTLQTIELPVPFGKFETSRYSFVEAYPQTGRMHQLRKHFAHIFHPIIGDNKHGCNKQNKLFKEKWQMQTMLLHARLLRFQHPLTGLKIEIAAPPQKEFLDVMTWMGFQMPDNNA